MSDLQLGLVAIGAVVVIAVLAYNKWQEIKYRREAERSLGPQHDDALMGSAEDAAGTPQKSSAAAGERAHAVAVERIEPTFERHDRDAVETVSSVVDDSPLSDSIDFVVPMEASTEVDGEVLIGAAGLLQGAPKPIRLEGFNEIDGKWEAPRRGVQYSLMRAGLQLVDRRGPVTESDLVSFGAGVQQLAAAAGALASVPSCGEAAALASELDEFSGRVDILIALHVVPRGTPFIGTKVRALAEANGLRLEEDGRFRRRDDGGRALYEIASVDATPFRAETLRTATVSGLMFEFDVARTPDPARVFEQFRELIGRFAQALEANVVDEKRAPVASAAFEQIVSQIQSIERAMKDRSIVPGSAPALRLFS